MGVLFLFVLQVQTLYYSPDHKLVDRGLLIEGQSEVFGGEEDHLHFVQVLPTSACRRCDSNAIFCAAASSSDDQPRRGRA